MLRLTLTLLLLASVSACAPGGRDTAPPTSRTTAAADPTTSAVDDVVVIAVIDSSINPYHFDYLAAHMPQHLNADPGDDLPLDQDPALWLPGHPGAAAFASYQSLDLSLSPNDPTRSTAVSNAEDAAQWGKIRYSEAPDNAAVHMHWIPGTKIIGHVAFFGDQVGDPVTSTVLPPSPSSTFAVNSHGIGTSSVAVGNLHGSCGNCLLVYVHGTTEIANEWVAKQDWIDLQTNSWGKSTTVRDRIYAGSNTPLQREAVERGQSIFFSAGNGQANAFVAPNPTLFSSQEGPDWIVTVGSIAPDGTSHSGHGKPADIASIGSGYPSATGGDGTTTAVGNFGGTSNATPVIAGMYGQALYNLRRQLTGPSRLQRDGLIAVGPAGCGAANPQCALADGQLTVHELREALFRGAQYTGQGYNVGGAAPLPGTANVDELRFLAEGHGSYYGRLLGDENYAMEIARITGFVSGDWFSERDPDQRDWFIADAQCRQGGWGNWDFGLDQLGPAAAADPINWPVRSFLSAACPSLLGAVVPVEQIKDGGS